MKKLALLTLGVCGLLMAGSYVRLELHLGEVKLVHWDCPACERANVTDAHDTLYPACRGCGEKLGWEAMAVAEGM